MDAPLMQLEDRKAQWVEIQQQQQHLQQQPHNVVTESSVEHKVSICNQTPNLLEGVLEANMYELFYIFGVCIKLLHSRYTPYKNLLSDTYKNLERLRDYVLCIKNSSAVWLDFDAPFATTTTTTVAEDKEENGGHVQVINPDSQHIKQTIVDVAKATIIQLMLNSIVIQNVFSTGCVYGSNEVSNLKAMVGKDTRVRWSKYTPIPEVALHTLLVHIQQNENVQLGDVVDTLQAARRWSVVDLPQITKRLSSHGLLKDKID